MKTLTRERAQKLAEFYIDVMGWSERGLMSLLEQCAHDDARHVALAVARISLDPGLDGPGVLPQHGQHWRDTDKVTPRHRRLCDHGQPADTVANATTSSGCLGCYPPQPPPRANWRDCTCHIDKNDQLIRNPDCPVHGDNPAPPDQPSTTSRTHKTKAGREAARQELHPKETP